MHNHIVEESLGTYFVHSIFLNAKFSTITVGRFWNGIFLAFRIRLHYTLDQSIHTTKSRIQCYQLERNSQSYDSGYQLHT